MKYIDMICWVSYLLIIVGALNWGLYGINKTDLVAMLLGEWSYAARTVYILVGASGIAHLLLHSAKE